MFRRRFPAYLILLAAAMCCGSMASAMTTFTFDDMGVPDNQGWGVLDYENGFSLNTNFAGAPAGTTNLGNPGGAIVADDPGAEHGARFSAPAPFIGNATNLLGANLSFELNVIEQFVPAEYTLDRTLGLIYIENGVQALIYTGALPTDSWAPGYSVTIGPNTTPYTESQTFNGAGELALGGLMVPDEGLWAYIANTGAIGPGAFEDPTVANFMAVLGSVDRFTITGEVIDGEDDVLALDNVHLSIVPIPAAFPLLLSAVFGLMVAGRRRNA